MANRLQEIKSLEEFRLKVLNLDGLLGDSSFAQNCRSRILMSFGLKYDSNPKDIRFSDGLEEFVDYIIQSGTPEQKFAVGWEELQYGMFPTDIVKTLIYTKPDNGLLLFLLADSNRLDKTKAQELYSPNGQIKMASQQDLQELGMTAKGCSGFPSASCLRDWKIVIDDRGIACRHPIYLQGTSRKAGSLYAAESFYKEVMQARFPNKVVQERISLSLI